LTVNDQLAALHSLQTVGYYRLLIYMRALQTMPGKTFIPGATFADIVTLYNFNRKLRVLCLDVIERIEVALRASIVNELAVAHGPHFYLDPRHFSTAESYRGFFSEGVQARYLAISHYAICEAVTFGALSHLYSGPNVTNRKLVARPSGFQKPFWFLGFAP
jgi:abortive infection bacteriophage resistance protein